MIEKIQAVGEYVFVIKDDPKTEFAGLKLPEPSIKKTNTGKILSVGKLVADKNVRVGMKAIFSKQVGSDIEIFDTEVTVLNGNQQLLGVF